MFALLFNLKQSFISSHNIRRAKICPPDIQIKFLSTKHLKLRMASEANQVESGLLTMSLLWLMVTGWGGGQRPVVRAGRETGLEEDA